jgi:hypothetical protein
MKVLQSVQIFLRWSMVAAFWPRTYEWIIATRCVWHTYIVSELTQLYWVVHWRLNWVGLCFHNSLIPHECVNGLEHFFCISEWYVPSCFALDQAWIPTWIEIATLNSHTVPASHKFFTSTRHSMRIPGKNFSSFFFYIFLRGLLEGTVIAKVLSVLSSRNRRGKTG